MVFGTVMVALHTAFLPLPSFAVQVMVAEPVFTAVTLPVLSTIAIAALLEVQLTALLVAVAGATVALIVPTFPTAHVMLVGDNVIDFTATFAAANDEKRLN